MPGFAAAVESWREMRVRQTGQPGQEKRDLCYRINQPMETSIAGETANHMIDGAPEILAHKGMR
jgi:hypothetical protein